MKKNALLTLLLIVVGYIASAQEKSTEHREMTWFGYFNQTRFTEKSGVWADVHWRLNDNFVNETHALLARLGYIYYVTDKGRLSVGYAYQKQPGHHGAADQLEHRSWQQFQWIEKKSWFNMMQWVRFEQRFRKTSTEQDYDFSNYRLRYNIGLTFPLNKKEVTPKTPFFFTNNEVFINFGENIVNNYFDQNRFFVGFGYQFTSHLNAQLGYMNIFQQLPAGNKYVSSDAIRLFVFHSIDLRANASH
jgi:hypothetical protein